MHINLNEALKRYCETKDDFFAHTITDEASALRHDELRRIYDDAAHSVAYHAIVLADALNLDMTEAQPPTATDEEWKAHNAALRLDSYSLYHPGFKRVIASIEQHDPLLEIIEPDAEHWNAIGRHPSELEKEETPEPEPDENQDADSSEWITAATEEELSWQSSNSGDLFDDYDDDDAYEW